MYSAGIKVTDAGTGQVFIIPNAVLVSEGAGSATIGASSGHGLLDLLGSGSSVVINNQKIVGDRRTGWTAASGTASRSGFDTSTATVAQVAQALKALIDDLIAHGLIGS
jgi:hypothetical protein